MKFLIASMAMLASAATFANPALDAAAAMEINDPAVAEAAEPTRRQVSGQVILGVEGIADDQGMRVTVPAPATHDSAEAAEAYPDTNLPPIVENYPPKR